MDTSNIVSTLAAGATELLKTDTAQVIKDAYAGLKRVIEEKLSDKENLEDAQNALRSVEKRPDAKPRQEVLDDELSEASIESDSMVQRAVQELTAVLQRYAPQTAAYFNLTASDDATVIKGDSNTAVGKGGVMIGGDSTGNISTGTQISGDYLRGDKVLGNKIRQQVNTGGGAYIGGNVTARGDFVGRDKIVNNFGDDAIEANQSPIQESARPIVALLNTYFSMDEIESLCFEMGIDDENLRGQTKEAKARSLVRYCVARDRLEELKRLMRVQRPNLRAQLM
jgi:hypothetical protein